MKSFAYNPEMFKIWVNSIYNYLNADNESINTCIKGIVNQIEVLASPKVWTGVQARKNYQNLVLVYQDLINFINNFNETFNMTITSFNNNIKNLEMNTEGLDINNIYSDSLKYKEITSLTNKLIEVDNISYNYNILLNVYNELNNIFKSLGNIYNMLNKKIEELDNKSGMWDGALALRVKENLKNILSTNMTKILENFREWLTNTYEIIKNA